MPRQRNAPSTVYLGRDGYWHGQVSVGVRNDGRPDRRHVMSKTKARVLLGLWFSPSARVMAGWSAGLVRIGRLASG
jgi:hypothetical protein